MKTMNSQIEAMIVSFAKSKKIGKAQLTEFVESVLSEVVIEQPAQPSFCKAGRKTTDEAIRVRDNLRKIHPTLKSTFLVKAVAQQLNTDQATLNNQLNWLASHESLFVKVGKADCDSRGRKPIMWMGV